MILDNQKSTNQKDDILFFYDDRIYEGKEGKSKKWNIYDWENEYANKNQGWNFKVINNLNKLDSKYNAENIYNTFPNTTNLNDLISYYDEKFKDQNKDYKFDLWMSEISLVELWEHNLVETNYNFIKHVNKIYLLTDGNYQTYSFVNDAVNRYNQDGYKQLTEQEVEDKFNAYRNDQTNAQLNDFKNYVLFDFIHDANIFTFFHIQPYTTSPYYANKLVNKNIKLYDTYYTSYNYYDFASNSLNPSWSSDEVKNKFISDYESFFRVNDKKSLVDFIDINKNAYDPKKKNIIWLGDSLVLNDSFIYPEKSKEVQSIMQSWLKLFPSNEYNFIAKHHPAYDSEEKQKWLTHWALNSNDDSRISYFSTVPWELLLTWNYKMQKTDKTYNGLFKEKNDTNFVGFQFTTTTIQSTAFFLVDNYGYTTNDLSTTLNSYYFPIPETFDVVTRTNSYAIDPKEQVEINKSKIAKIYDPFVEMKAYPDYKQNQVLGTDFIKQNYDANYSINPITPTNDDSLTTIILLSVLVPIAVIGIIVATYFLVKHNRKKKFNQIKK